MKSESCYTWEIKKTKIGDRKENNLFVFNTKRKAETNEGVGEKHLCDDMI